MALLTLPPELLAMITSLSDPASQKALRLTSRILCSLATKSLFRSVSLFDDDGSCHAVKSIMTHPHLKEQVHKIYLNTVEYDFDLDYGHIKESEPPQRWRKLLAMLPTLSNLESIALIFDKHCVGSGPYRDVPHTEEYRETIIEWLISEVVCLRQPLNELAIQNHQNVIPLGEQGHQVLGALRSLRLNVVHEEDLADPEKEILLNDFHEFYTRSLPSVWLKPAMSSLRRLSLYSNMYWGFYPKPELEELHFPDLQSLTLGNYCFFEDAQMNWIISHSSTLQELYLDDCPILFQAKIWDTDCGPSRWPIAKSDLKYDKGCHWPIYRYPRRWYDYFTSMETGLPRLRHFAIGHNISWDEWGLPFEQERDIIPALMHDRYMVFDVSISNQFREEMYDRKGYPAEQRPECDEEDMRALKALYQRIGQHMDCGEIEIGDREVKNLVEVRTR